MKSRALASLAALVLLAMPVSVVAARPDEIELHIEATTQIAPDRAVVAIIIRGSGKSEAEVRAKLRKEEDKLMTALSAKGIDATKVKTDGADAGNDAVTIRANNEAAACAVTASDAAAADAAAAAAAAPRRVKANSPVVDWADCHGQGYLTANKTLLVSFDDPSKIEQVQALLNTEDNSYGRLPPIYSQSDPAAARKKARAEALAKANAEADAYADAMGYRVVRIVRVSNARPALNMNDLIGFIAKLEDRVRRLEPSWLAATVTETVAIDYVIAPK